MHKPVLSLKRIPLKYIFVTLGLGLVQIIVFQNCGLSRPHVDGTGFKSNPSFAHPGITNGCAVCHDTGGAYARFPTTYHPDRGGQDCSSCHTVGATWATASPHAIGQPVPSQCSSCHLISVPYGNQGTASIENNITPTGGLFDHAGPFGGNGDCVSCHTSVPENIGVTWSGGVYDHSPTPTTCSSCHTTNQQPIGLVGNPVFDHATNPADADCVSCHAAIPGNIGKVWTQGGFSHNPVPTECSSCHTADPKYTSVQNTIKNQMLHTHVGLPD